MNQSYDRFFPKDSPYPNQSEAMREIHDALNSSRDVVFEGACGTGKTLSALVPSLEIAKEEDKTVVITTNVHQQMRQFIQEAREIKEMEADVNVTVFQGKSSMCHIDVGYDECEALRENTYDLVDYEEDLRELKAERRNTDDPEEARELDERIEGVENGIEDLRQNTCDHFYSNITDDNGSFHRWLKMGVRSPEQVKGRAEKCGKCGYELLKEGMEGVDLVICNYHHLLSPEIRDYFFNWLDQEPEDVIAVFDEAHNLEDAAREHSSRTITGETLERAELELAEEGRQYEEERELISDFREALKTAVRENLEFGEAENSEWTDVMIQSDGEYGDEVSRNFFENSMYSEKNLTERVREGLKAASKIDKRYEREYKEGETEKRKECPSMIAFSFMNEYLRRNDEPGYLPIASIRRRGSEPEHRLELYTCIPSEVTRTLFDQLHSSILMSATLRPFDVVETVLGLDDPVELAYGLEFPPEKRETLVADLPPLFSRNRDDPETIEALTDFIEDVVEYTPGNALLFFPSQSEAERYYNRIRVDAHKLIDEVGESATEIRDSMSNQGKKVLFTYLWGTLTEGVDFPDETARTVVVVGVGYPYLSDRKRAVESAYDEEFGDGEGWKYAVEAPTIRKTRQALGRILRSPDDYGVRILADSRYSPDEKMGKYSVYDAFPPEERNEFVEVDPGKVKYALYNFWKKQGVEEDIDI